MNLVFDQEHFDLNVAAVQNLINKKDDPVAQSLAFESLFGLLKVPYDDDNYILKLLDLEAMCQINEMTYTTLNEANITSFGTSLAINNAKDIHSRSVTISMTSCKRLNLFIQTVNSFLACCTDLAEYIYEWIVVDDNSSQIDRDFMKRTYPFINFVFKSPDEKGHARSMNIIRNLIKTPWAFHLEDDWRFFIPDKYIGKCLEVLEENPRYGQCLFNRGYGEDIISAARIAGGHRRYTNGGCRYYIHEYAVGDALNKLYTKIASHGRTSASYWPHYSLRVGMTRRSVFDKIGSFNESADHFEREYANRYREQFLTTYLDNCVCTHTGRKTYERSDVSKINAYDLNKERQFGQDPKTGLKEDDITLDKISAAVTTLVPVSTVINTTISLKIALKVYVLNLKRRKDRLDKFRTLNRDELPFFHIFNGVDGMALKPCHLIQKLFEHNDYNYRRGLVGCAVSHLAMWIELVNSTGLDGMLIIEDDALLTTNFIQKFNHLITTYTEADIIFLGHHPYPHAVKVSDSDKSAMPIAEQWSKEKSIRDSMGGTTAYWISKKGAANMINWIERRSFYNGVDWEMFKNDSNKVYYASPFLAFAECFQSSGTTVDTDIQTVYSGAGYKDSDEWFQTELAYWGFKGVRSRLPGMSCSEDLESKICCYHGKCSKKELLSDIAIFPRSNEITEWLNEFPVHWYEVGEYVFSVPDNKLSDRDVKSICFYGYLNLTAVRSFVESLG